jgi:hypothetical protein
MAKLMAFAVGVPWPANNRRQPTGPIAEVFMKRILTLAVAVIFSAAIVGCHAEAGVDAPNDHRDTSVKKTTTIDRDGDRTTKIETHSNP